MNIQPRISVLMGVYNGGRFLSAAIDSILKQTFSDFEFIIIDDGSTDETESILSSYEDNRLIIVRNLDNMGLTKSLNKGLKLARGEYVARQDADDLSHLDRFKEQVLFLNSHQNCAMVGCQAKLINEEGVFLEKINVASDPEIIKSKLIQYNQFVHGSVLMRRSILDDLRGYRECFRYTQDYDLWLRMVENYDLCNLADTLYSLRRVSTSISLKSYDRQLAFAVLARGFFMERQEKKMDSYDMLDANQPEALLSNSFPHLITGLAQEKFSTCINLAKESQQSNNLQHELYWFKTALLCNGTIASFVRVLKLFCLWRIMPVISLYERHIGWRFKSN